MVTFTEHTEFNKYLLLDFFSIQGYQTIYRLACGSIGWAADGLDGFVFVHGER